MNGSRKKEYYKHFLKEFLLDYSLMNDPKKNLHCINPDHEDVHPSACFYEDRNVVTCFACGKSYDIYDAIGFQFGLTSFNEQIQTMNRYKKLKNCMGQCQIPTNKVF